MVLATEAAAEERLLLSPLESAQCGRAEVGRGRRVSAVNAVLLVALCALVATLTDIIRVPPGRVFSSLGIAADLSFDTCADGFVDELPKNPKASIFLDKMPSLADSESSHLSRCANELTNLPVVTSNDAYRLGNAVERQGVGWLGARRLVLEDEAGYKDSILFNFLMGENEEQRAFVGCVVERKRALERAGMDPDKIHGDNNTIVIPLRLSDKVRFMVEDYPVINTAIVEYKKTHCPWCTNLVIMTLLVWGEDNNHMFAYNYDEYKQSLTVLHSIAKRAQTPEGGGLKVTVRSTLNADVDFVYSAYSPHLVLPMVTPSSWHQLLTYCNRAVFDPVREAASFNFFESVVAPKLTMPGRRLRLLNAYRRLEAAVPDDLLINWFQLEVQKRGLTEHHVTVTQMDRWNDWPSIVRPYEVGMGAYDGAVRSIAKTHSRDSEHSASADTVRIDVGDGDSMTSRPGT